MHRLNRVFICTQQHWIATWPERKKVRRKLHSLLRESVFLGKLPAWITAKIVDLLIAASKKAFPTQA